MMRTWVKGLHTWFGYIGLRDKTDSKAWLHIYSTQKFEVAQKFNLLKTNP